MGIGKCGVRALDSRFLRYDVFCSQLHSGLSRLPKSEVPLFSITFPLRSFNSRPQVAFRRVALNPVGIGKCGVRAPDSRFRGKDVFYSQPHSSLSRLPKSEVPLFSATFPLRSFNFRPQVAFRRVALNPVDVGKCGAKALDSRFRGNEVFCIK